MEAPTSSEAYYIDREGRAWTAMDLLPDERRVIGEQQELEGKIARLDAFTADDAFTALAVTEQLYLTQQRAAMAEYDRILKRRIAYFTSLRKRHIE